MLFTTNNIVRQRDPHKKKTLYTIVVSRVFYTYLLTPTVFYTRLLFPLKVCTRIKIMTKIELFTTIKLGKKKTGVLFIINGDVKLSHSKPLVPRTP